MMLEQGGYGGDIAYTAGHPKRLLAERSYALMTLDILLPDQDGISPLGAARRREHAQPRGRGPIHRNQSAGIKLKTFRALIETRLANGPTGDGPRVDGEPEATP